MFLHPVCYSSTFATEHMYFFYCVSLSNFVGIMKKGWVLDFKQMLGLLHFCLIKMPLMQNVLLVFSLNKFKSSCTHSLCSEMSRCKVNSYTEVPAYKILLICISANRKRICFILFTLPALPLCGHLCVNHSLANKYVCVSF